MSEVPNQKPMVLIAEDYVFNRNNLTAILSQAGWIVVGTGDGAQALEKAMNTTFQLHIFDHHLPHMKGLEVLQRLRAAGNTVPTVMMSSVPMIDFHQKSREAGAFQVLGVPVLKPILLKIAESVLRAQFAD